MKLIVGLGNPGSQYEKTRHNAGFLAVDRLVRRWAPSELPKGRFSGVAVEAAVKGEKCLLLKPTTYMNLSGKSVAEAVGFYKINPAMDLLVIVDDVALPTGSVRVRQSGSAGGHNGLSDIQQKLGTDAYSRLRIGIDACPPMMKLEDYVLGRFTSEQATLLEPALEKSADAAELFITSGVTAAMNTYNVRPPNPSQNTDSGAAA
ncbi:MAG: aminoacyl-tRNA hydrolase [Phycisphaerales bacterium]|nr:aminoacyl-tRNA hydrolase [Phycisphaerales bacterium]